ncbi:hypothetical protein MTBBW1_1150005 [Desulfamplus magnetovallimortis]|uniref:Uncharacterized protein n=1 Tax=Desulfamplus magnetovallimortis TaxID=1246637 RepID=A0A1W1H5V2_9BACT|nr:hypothetical protein [Desulfamplus magnetovallimortis]SLM27832.1 hypothetical protein MTBBW1_1150005 [Desulfamplus magnetovallimortis]
MDTTNNDTITPEPETPEPETTTQTETQRIRNRISKYDDIETTIEKLTGQRDAKARWRYRTEEETLNASIVAMHHLTPLNILIERNLKEINQLKIISAS